MKNTLQYKGFLGSIEISTEDNCLHGKLMFIEDLVTYEADSVAKLKSEFESAVEDYLNTCKKLDRDPIKPFSGTFNVRIGPELHQALAHYAIKITSSINDVVKKALVEYIEKPSSKQVIHTHYHTYRYQKTFDIGQVKTLKNGQEKTWEKGSKKIWENKRYLETVN